MSSSPDSSSSGKIGISPHLNPRFSRIKADYQKRLFNYEKEFNIKTSRSSTHREKVLRESMLAYTERIRKISNPRGKFDSDDSDTDDNTIPLVVRAKHIPKFPAKRNLQRRPASLDELIGKRNLVKQEKDRLNKRPKSASRVPSNVSLPALPDRIQERSHHVKISFVSASDLYDFVDYSLRNRGTKKETLQFLQMEKDILTKKAQNNHNHKRPSAAHARVGEISSKSKEDVSANSFSTLPPIESKEHKDEPDEVSVNVKSGSPPVDQNVKDKQTKNAEESGRKSPVVPLKIRPNRAKRMKIRQPDLGSIPEHDVSKHNISQASERTISSPSSKMSPRNVITIDSNLVRISENDIHNESGGFSGRKKLSKMNIRKLESNRNSPFGKIDSLLSNEKRFIDVDDLDLQSPNSNKLKAQKKFKKLIFLRDIPDRK